MVSIEGGHRPVRAAPRPEADVPAVLRAALDADPAPAAVFDDRFAPSQRRAYCDWVAEAKRDATRAARVAQAVAWIREGKQRDWRYQR